MRRGRGAGGEHRRHSWVACLFFTGFSCLEYLGGENQFWKVSLVTDNHEINSKRPWEVKNYQRGYLPNQSVPFAHREPSLPVAVNLWHICQLLVLTESSERFAASRLILQRTSDSPAGSYGKQMLEQSRTEAGGLLTPPQPRHHSEEWRQARMGPGATLSRKSTEELQIRLA